MEKIDKFCIFVVVHSRSRSRSRPTWEGIKVEDTSDIHGYMTVTAQYYDVEIFVWKFTQILNNEQYCAI